MSRKFFIAWIVIFIAWIAGSYVVHGVLLNDDYIKSSGLFRSEAEGHPYFPIMVLAHVIWLVPCAGSILEGSRARRGFRRGYGLA